MSDDMRLLAIELAGLRPLESTSQTARIVWRQMVDLLSRRLVWDIHRDLFLKTCGYNMISDRGNY